MTAWRGNCGDCSDRCDATVKAGRNCRPRAAAGLPAAMVQREVVLLWGGVESSTVWRRQSKLPGETYGCCVVCMGEQRRCVPILVAVVVALMVGCRVSLALSYPRVFTRALSDYGEQ